MSDKDKEKKDVQEIILPSIDLQQSLASRPDTSREEAANDRNDADDNRREE